MAQNQVSQSDLAFCIVSFHEQVLGCQTYLAKAKTSADVIRGYEMLDRVLSAFASAIVLPFDSAASSVYDKLVAQRVRIATMDLRIARTFHLAERAGLELMAEAFNICNRLNFRSVNNTVGNIAPPFDLKGRRDVGPSQPLGFTSAFDPRRIQLGVRLTF